MIAPSRAVVIGGATAAATLAGALIVGRRGSAARRAGCVVGLGGMAAAAAFWLAADRQDREITRNPETMNAHFLTAGESSAMTSNIADLGQIRRLVGSHALAVAGPGRGKGAHRGHRLR